MRFWLIILILSLPCGVFAQAHGRLETEDTPIEPISIEARVIETTPTAVHAEGDVTFRQGQKLLLADEVFYNYEERTGLLTDATFTTCDVGRMHYRITAREIALSPDQRLRARRVRIFFGNTRLISLPSLVVNVGSDEDRQTIIPRPGYDSDDGFFLASRYSLMDTAKQNVNLRLRLTSRNNIQGGITASRTIIGDAREVPPYLPDFDSELRRESVLLPRVGRDGLAFPKDRHREPLLSVFGGALVRERMYDIDQRNLMVTRLPELGVRYVSPRLNVSSVTGLPEVGVQYEGRISWGKYKESPDGERAGRLDIRGTASTALATFGESTALRLAGLARYSSYNTGESYRAIGGALDFSRIFPSGSFASIRFIAHGTSGSTPFEFDDIDIKRELQAVGRYVHGRNTYGILLDYDLDKSSLRDWEFSISRKFHCLEPGITWRNRFSQISVTVKVLGL